MLKALVAIAKKAISRSVRGVPVFATSNNFTWRGLAPVATQNWISAKSVRIEITSLRVTHEAGLIVLCVFTLCELPEGSKITANSLYSGALKAIVNAWPEERVGEGAPAHRSQMQKPSPPTNPCGIKFLGRD